MYGFTVSLVCINIVRVSHSIMSDSVTPWTVAHQAPLSMGFSRQEYWSGLPFPSPGGLPDPGIEPPSPALQVDSFSSKPPGELCLLPYRNSDESIFHFYIRVYIATVAKIIPL